MSINANAAKTPRHGVVGESGCAHAQSEQTRHAPESRGLGNDEPPPIVSRAEPFVTNAEFDDAEHALRRSAGDRIAMLPFTIVIDTREQTPLTFPRNVSTRRGTLHTGDYSIAGWEDVFTIERKSLADAIHTVMHDRDRFVRELERMQSFAFRRIIITAPFARVLRGHYNHSRAKPNSVIGLWRSLEVKYNTPITFADDGDQAARHVTDWAKYFTRQHALRPINDDVPPPHPPPGVGSFKDMQPPLSHMRQCNTCTDSTNQCQSMTNNAKITPKGGIGSCAQLEQVEPQRN